MANMTFGVNIIPRDNTVSLGNSDHPWNIVSPNLTGVPVAPTATAGTNTTQVATTAFVKTATDVKVTGPSSATNNAVAIFDGTGGKTIKNSDFTIGKSVPSDAKFTDTTYSAATQSAAGLMSAADKTKLDGVATGATANVGTITGITMNGSSKGTSGVVDLGTVITSHQDISGKVSGPSSATNNAVAIFDGTGGKTIKNSGFTIGKSVPSDAKFTDTTYSQISRGSSAGLAPGLPSGSGTTKYLREDGSWQVPPDTNTWRGIQNNLTSTSTTDSLSAAQGKVLNDNFNPTEFTIPTALKGVTIQTGGYIKIGKIVFVQIRCSVDGYATMYFTGLPVPLNKDTSNLTWPAVTCCTNMDKNVGIDGYGKIVGKLPASDAATITAVYICE